MSGAPFFLSLAALVTFGYSFHFLRNDPKVQTICDFFNTPELKNYGHLQFMTFQCLCFQLLNTTLHILAYLTEVFVKPRDFVFNSLAYPVGSIVCYGFWGSWFVFGREKTFPAAIDAIYPPWLNQTTHTLMVPINILLALMINHKYHPRQATTFTSYMLFYLVLINYIKYQTGSYVYKFLDKLGAVQLIFYFLFIAILSALTFKSGHVLKQLAHGRERSPRLAVDKKKQK